MRVPFLLKAGFSCNVWLIKYININSNRNKNYNVHIIDVLLLFINIDTFVWIVSRSIETSVF